MAYNISRRGALALGGAAGFSALLAACGGSSDSKSSNGGKEGSDSAKLRIWFMKDSVSDESMAWLKSAFEKKYPKSSITYEIQNWDGIVPKLQTSLASPDSTPDIIELGNTQAPAFCAVGALMDLSSMKDELGGSNLTKSLVDTGTFEKKMYAAPFYAGSRLFYYRKDFFDAAGLQIPKTMDELTQVATKLQAANPGGNPNFSGLWLPGISAQSGFAWLFSMGGRLATQEGDKWKGGLSSDKAQKAYGMLQEIWKNGSKAGTITDSTLASQPATAFNAGESGMFFGFQFNAAKIDQGLMSSGKVGNFGFPPAEAGGQGHPFAGGSNVAISAKSQNQKMAKEVMKLIFSEDFQNGFGKAGWVPGNIKYAESLGTDELSKLSVEAVKNSVATPAAKNWALVEGAKIPDDFNVAVAAGGDIKSLAADADKKMEAKLNG